MYNTIYKEGLNSGIFIHRINGITNGWSGCSLRSPPTAFAVIFISTMGIRTHYYNSMDAKFELDPRNFVDEACSRRFRLEAPRAWQGGKVAQQLYSYADQVELLHQILGVLLPAKGTPTADGGSPEFEIDLSELKPLRDGPGIPFGPIVDSPIKFSHSGAPGVWSCSFPIADGNHFCTVRANGKDLVEYQIDNQIVRDDPFNF